MFTRKKTCQSRGEWIIHCGTRKKPMCSILKCLFVQTHFFFSVFLSAVVKQQSNKAIIMFEGDQETHTVWYLVPICPGKLPSKRDYRHWPPTHLEVCVSDPLHYSVTCPNNGITVLVLTFCPSRLQGLRKHNTQIAAKALMWPGPSITQREVREGWWPAEIMPHQQLLCASSYGGK